MQRDDAGYKFASQKQLQSSNSRPNAMAEDRPPDPATFARQFREKYGRDMTPAEKRFYELTRQLLHPPKDESKKDDGEAA
jgi:hypothetical protein